MSSTFHRYSLKYCTQFHLLPRANFPFLHTSRWWLINVSSRRKKTTVLTIQKLDGFKTTLCCFSKNTTPKCFFVELALTLCYANTGRCPIIMKEI